MAETNAPAPVPAASRHSRSSWSTGVGIAGVLSGFVGSADVELRVLPWLWLTGDVNSSISGFTFQGETDQEVTADETTSALVARLGGRWVLFDDIARPSIHASVGAGRTSFHSEGERAEFPRDDGETSVDVALAADVDVPVGEVLALRLGTQLASAGVRFGTRQFEDRDAPNEQMTWFAGAQLIPSLSLRAFF